MTEADTDYLVRRISSEETLDQIVAFPRYFEIETINACNAKCPMCSIGDWQRQPQVMKDELFQKIVDEIALHASEVQRVHLYRDGEPLLDKKLAHRIRLLKQAGIRKVGISTNAELLTPDRCENILEAGLDELILSVDSLVPDVYKQIRVGLDMGKVLANSHAAFILRDGLKASCRIRVRMIRQESNRQEWDSGSFQRYWRDVVYPGWDTIEYRDIHNWGGSISGHTFHGETQRPCIALWSLMVIFADGTVPLCNVDYNAKHKLGNVKDNTIAELWQSQEQNRRRKIHMHGLRAAIPPCTNCTVWSEHSKQEAAIAA